MHKYSLYQPLHVVEAVTGKGYSERKREVRMSMVYVADFKLEIRKYLI